MINNDLVSVIIPCYNQSQYLEEAVQSVLDQTYGNIEIIIINDGSPDNTEEIASQLQAKFPRKIYLLSQDNTGLSEARNNGIKKSSGKYILPLDADDKLDAKMISQCMYAMLENNADIVYTNLQCFGIENHIAKKKSFSENNILYENLPTLTSLYKKEVWKKVNGYKLNMRGGYEDWEFWINAYKNNFVFYFLPEVLFYYRIKKESMHTDARTKHTYLCSKIVINHSELYTDEKQDDAIKEIKAFENLADLYFYLEADTFPDEKELVSRIGDYLHDKQSSIGISPEETHILSATDKLGSMALCSLESIENKEMMEQMSAALGVNHIVFYAKLKYNMTNIDKLKVSHFAWSDKKGIVLAEGTSFPFVLHDNSMLKITAYKRSEKYTQEKYQRLESALLQKDNHTTNLEVKIKDQDEQIKRLRNELTLIYRSNSWRYTRIIRQLRKKLHLNKKISRTEME